MSRELHKKKWVPDVVEEREFSVWRLVIAPCSAARPRKLFYSIYIYIQSIKLFTLKSLTGSYHSEVRTLSFLFYRTFSPKIMLCFPIPVTQQAINTHTDKELQHGEVLVRLHLNLHLFQPAHEPKRLLAEMGLTQHLTLSSKPGILPKSPL